MKIRQTKHPIYKLNNLPCESQDYFYFKNQYSGKEYKSYTGSIFRRISDNGGGLTWHYSFFYGFINNIPYVIHNDLYGVECISFIDYMGRFKEYETFPMLHNDNKEIIIKRAISVSNKHFHLQINNCEHFTNYCVYEKNISLQGELSSLIENFIDISLFSAIISTNSNYLLKRYLLFKKNIKKIPKIKHN